MRGLILSWLPLTISFAAGYGIREWISRRRRAIARKDHFERLQRKAEQHNYGFVPLGQTLGDNERPDRAIIAQR